MKRIHNTHYLWAVLVLAIPSAMQTASLDEVKGSSSRSDSSPKIGFTNQLGSARDITKEEAEASALIRSALRSDPQAQVLLNLDHCAGYSLDEIKQLLGLLAAQNAEAIQAYLAKKDDRSLYELYQLSDYLWLDLSLQDKILTVLAKRIAALAEPKRSLFGSLKSWGSSLWGSSKKELSQKERVQEHTYDQIDIRFIQAVHAKLAFELLTHSQILRGHTNIVYSVVYSPDGAQIASGSLDYTVRIWDAATGALLHTLQGHTDPVTSVAYSPDGKYIVSGSWDRTVRIWDAATGELLNTLKGHRNWVTSVAYSPDGTHIASGSEDRTIRIWDAATRVQVGTLAGHARFVTSVAYSPDGKHIVFGSNDGTVRIWDAATGVQVGEPLQGHTNKVLSVAYSPDGKHIASGSEDRTMRIWNAATGGLVRTLAGHTDKVLSVAYSPDGSQIASGSYDERIRIWGESAKQLDETIKKWSREKLFKEFSFEAVKAQRPKKETYQSFQQEWENRNMPELEAYKGPSPFEQPSDDKDAGWFNSKPAKKPKPLAFEAASASADVERE